MMNIQITIYACSNLMCLSLIHISVTTDDLLPLAEQGKGPPKEVTPEPEPKPTEPVEEVPEPEPEKKDSPLLSMLLILSLIHISLSGLFYYGG